jgi:crotonobetainyl-CoA:carnitine CoA-transferase CaiB-like acyl-CoA transferase
MAGILSGIRVIDLTQYLAGPQATLFLAGLGADVIRVDNPATGDRTADSAPYLGPEGVSLQRRTPADLGVPYLKRARGKRAVTLDLKHSEALGLFRALLRQSDVVVENWTVGTAARLGVDYAACRAAKPDLVYCSITGYGQSGPDAGARAYDNVVQAAAGLMSITGEPDGPPMKAGSAIADTVAGTFAFAGILAALFHRLRTGEGQHVDVSMADCLVALVLDESLDVWPDLGLPTRQGNRIPRLSPFNAYPTRDGGIAIGAASEPELARLLDVIGRADLKSDASFMNPAWRVAHNDRVDAVIGEWTRARETVAAVDRLRRAEIACAPIRDVDALKAWPQLAARGMLEPLRHPTLGPWPAVVAPGFPLKFSETAGGYATPAPLVGRDNEAVWGDLLGFDAAALRARGVI